MNSNLLERGLDSGITELQGTLDIVLPVFNEQIETVMDTVTTLQETFADHQGVTIIVVDDGSDKRFRLDELRERTDLTFVQHQTNYGYGVALKTGILSGQSDRIAIADSDGTYPVADLARMLEEMDSHDMVIGTRTGKIREIPWLRRFPKLILNLFASYFAGVRIIDLNSGLRIFSRDLCYYLWDFFPRGFSFTSTITMGAIMGGFRVKELPINYYRRTGKSSIKPIEDTIRFFKIISKIGLIFYPMKLFAPIAILLFVVGIGKGIVFDYINQGFVGTMSAILMIAGVQTFMMGLIGELIVHSRFTQSRPKIIAPLKHDE
jgi:glycosyltransferase involved in cell wall biosynthesis